MIGPLGRVSKSPLLPHPFQNWEAQSLEAPRALCRRLPHGKSMEAVVPSLAMTLRRHLHCSRHAMESSHITQPPRHLP